MVATCARFIARKAFFSVGVVFTRIPGQGDCISSRSSRSQQDLGSVPPLGPELLTMTYVASGRWFPKRRVNVRV